MDKLYPQCSPVWCWQFKTWQSSTKEVRSKPIIHYRHFSCQCVPSPSPATGYRFNVRVCGAPPLAKWDSEGSQKEKLNMKKRTLRPAQTVRDGKFLREVLSDPWSLVLENSSLCKLIDRRCLSSRTVRVQHVRINIYKWPWHLPCSPQASGK